jgi:hypothetical protein
VSKALIPILFLTLVFCSSPLLARTADGGHTGKKKYRLDDIVVSQTQTPDREYVVRVLRGRRQIFFQQCAFRVHDPQIFNQVPVPGARSLVAYCYSGGAHCCMTLILATGFNAHKTVCSVDLAHSSSCARFVDAAEDGAMELKVTDWQFAYYGINDSSLQFSFVDSPSMTRLLVYDGDKWRVDRIGEFGRFYSRLFRQASREAEVAARSGYPEQVAGRAIRAAYYCFMSGSSAERAAASLDRLLPALWKPETAKIVDDITRAASEFNPVQTIE